jgi:hypothetical protein
MTSAGGRRKRYSPEQVVAKLREAEKWFGSYFAATAGTVEDIGYKVEIHAGEATGTASLAIGIWAPWCTDAGEDEQESY